MNNWKKVYVQPWMRVTIGEGTFKDGISIYESQQSFEASINDFQRRMYGQVFDSYSKPFTQPIVAYVDADLKVKWVGNRYKRLSEIPTDSFQSIESVVKYFNSD